MGLFDIKGLTDIDPSLRYGSPLFRKVTIHLNEDYYPGDTFVIATTGNSPEHVYVQLAKLNGVPLKNTVINWADFVAGGKLELAMGKTPPGRPDSFN